MPLYERSVGFASLRNSGRSTSGIHARPLSKVRCCRPKKIRATTGGIASRCTEYCYSHNSLKSTPRLSPTPTLPKPHYPSKIANTLASLVKGEVLSPEKIRATTGGIASRCTEYCHSHNHCKRTIIPLLRTNPPKTALSLATHHILPPLSKVRCCRPKKFGRLPEGLPPVAPNTAIPIIISKVQSSLAPHHILSSIVKGGVLSDK